MLLSTLCPALLHAGTSLILFATSFVPLWKGKSPGPEDPLCLSEESPSTPSRGLGYPTLLYSYYFLQLHIFSLFWMLGLNRTLHRVYGAGPRLS
jgi:hypothetical protein